MENEIFKIKVLIPYLDNHSSKPANYSPYRVIGIKSKTTLYEFARIVLESFNFELDHPFGFYETTKNYLSAKKGYVLKEEGEDIWTTFDPDNIYGDVNKATLEDMLTRRGKKWLMLFDYGDEWSFWVSLVDKREEKDNSIYPMILESHMEAPLQYDDEF